MWLYWMESETVYAGDCLSKFQRQNVIRALHVFCTVWGAIFSELLNTLNFLWNNCTLKDHLRQYGFDFGFGLMIQRSIFFFFFFGYLNQLLHCSTCYVFSGMDSDLDYRNSLTFNILICGTGLHPYLTK